MTHLTVDVPPDLQRSRLRYPPHNQDYGIEAEFHRYVARVQLLTRAHYLPIYWTNNYHAQVIELKNPGDSPLQVVPVVEEFLKTLDPVKQYYTVSQGAEGIYERLPPNVFVFSSGGVGHEPLPLISTPHPKFDRPRDLLASFCGEFSPCGPVPSAKPTRCSSSDLDGPGSQVRHKMQEAFGPRDDCVLLSWQGGGVQGIYDYQNLAARSWFGLAPRGYGKTSFRLYEMFSIGTVPVYIFDDEWLPYRDRLDWSSFCVLCHVSEVQSLPQKLLSLKGGWWVHARKIADELFEKYFTMDGTCQQITRMVQEKWPIIL